MKKSSYFSKILFSFSLVFLFQGFLHVFFPYSFLYKLFVRLIPFVYFWSFPMLFLGVMVLMLLVLILISKYLNRERKVYYLSLIVIGLCIVSLMLSKQLKINNSFPTQVRPSKRIRLVEWNAHGSMSNEAMVKIFQDFDADIAIFPELHHLTLLQNDFFAKNGLDSEKYAIFNSFQYTGQIAPVTVVVKKALGSYQQIENVPETSLGTVYLKAKDDTLPDIVALHTAPPLPSLMKSWRNDLSLIEKEMMPHHPRAIFAGDFNATYEHLRFMNHDDALWKTKKGTWPSFAFEIFKTQIDHVFVPKNHAHVDDVDVEHVGDSDHLGVFVNVIWYVNDHT